MDLDRQIAEKVMGWTGKGRPVEGAPDIVRSVWNPSEDWNQTWQVVDKLRGEGWFFRLSETIELNEWDAEFGNPSSPRVRVACHADPREAVLRAALMTVESPDA